MYEDIYMCVYIYIYTFIYTARQPDKQTYIHTGRQIDRQTDRHIWAAAAGPAAGAWVSSGGGFRKWTFGSGSCSRIFYSRCRSSPNAHTHTHTLTHADTTITHTYICIYNNTPLG